mgnify:CR=1 FL=1
MTEKTIVLLSTKLDRTLTKDDQIAFMDYCTYYGLEKDEAINLQDFEKAAKIRDKIVLYND